MSFTFYVPVASALLWQGAGLGDQPIDPTNLNKEVSDPSPTATDNTYRLAWGPNQTWRLKGTTGSVAVDHSGITQVRLLARAFISNNGPDGWSWNTVGVDDGPFACPYFKWDGSHVKYAADEWYGAPPDLIPQTFVGYDIDAFHNFNQAGNPSPRVIQVDITGWPNAVGLGATWTNALLSNREFGLSMDGEQIDYNHFAGRIVGTVPGGTAPRYNVSQLILEVTADDPAPPPPTLGRTLILVSE